MWKLWGEPQAINVGDAVFAIAGRTIVDAHPDPRVSLGLTRRFHEVTMRLTEGQYLDMSFETRDDVTADEYIAMIERKSGALIAYSAWSGAFLAKTDTLTAEALHSFGMCLGRAFQMRDDLLGIWAARQMTGKEPAGDLANRKKTLPVLIAWERSTGQHRQILSRFFRREHEDVDAVKEVLDLEGARDETVRRGRSELENALRALSAADLEPNVCDQLESVARTLSP